MNGERWVHTATFTGAVLGGLAVAAGAFGAHALRATLGPTELASFETAVRYQMYHGLALLLAARAGAGRAAPLVRLSCWCFLSGSVLFSGSLYVLALTGYRWLGAITPVGGVLLLAGWALLAVAALRSAGG